MKSMWMWTVASYVTIQDIFSSEVHKQILQTYLDGTGSLFTENGQNVLTLPPGKSTFRTRDGTLSWLNRNNFKVTRLFSWVIWHKKHQSFKQNYSGFLIFINLGPIHVDSLENVWWWWWCCVSAISRIVCIVWAIIVTASRHTIIISGQVIWPRGSHDRESRQ